MRTACLLVTLAGLLSFTPGLIAGDGVEIWISPSGDDRNPGLQAAPVATLVRAQELERAAVQRGQQTTVNLLPGDYAVPSQWTLTQQDSGTAAAPVVWLGTEPGKARLLGCRLLPADKWTPLDEPALIGRLDPAAAGHVQQIDFESCGLQNVSPLPDFGRTTELPFQLFAQDEFLPLSRWPAGRYGYTTLARVTDNGGGSGGAPQGGTFIYREDEPARWIAALGDEGVWVRGFWRVPWVAETVRVNAIDPSAKSITLATAVSGGLGSKYVKDSTGRRVGSGKENWCALNLLEEIHAPGDWSIDFSRKKIFLWPPIKGAVSLSETRGPLVTLSQASHVTLRGLALGWTLGDGIRIEGGDHVSIVACQLREIGKTGVIIDGGMEQALLGNDIEHVGLSAIDVTGGDRATLTPCHDEICNNAIGDVAMSAPTPAILAGSDAQHQNVVGVHIAHNRIMGASNGGINFAGNDNLLEYNEIAHVGLDSGDLGAFYTTGGWTSRGNVVRYNFIHDCENGNGIYMDDGDCGLQAYGNLIVRTECGFLVGGGHDHILRNNLIVDSDHAFSIDDRGVTRHYTATDHRLRSDYDSVPVASTPWATEYPGLADFLKSDPTLATNDQLDSNIAVGCGSLVRRSGKEENLQGYQITNNAEISSDSIFIDPDHLNFHLKDPAALTNAVKGFPDLPLEKMGLQLDSNRTAIPEPDRDVLAEAQRKFDSQQDIDSSRKNP